MLNYDDRRPEILDALEEKGNYFCIVQLKRETEQRRFRFGVSRAGYMSLKRALQLRPFDQMPGLRHRYHFVGGGRGSGGQSGVMTVRVERGKDGTQIDVEASLDLVANLMWFYKLDDWNEANHLALQ